jgi:hypothetical protein
VSGVCAGCVYQRPASIGALTNKHATLACWLRGALRRWQQLSWTPVLKHKPTASLAGLAV